jgi:hypothetical protein
MDQAEARDRFLQARNRLFRTPALRRMALVIGTGLHHYLHSQGTRYPNCVDLRDWNEFLRSARLNTENSTEEFSSPTHDDPTSTWESMLLERSRKVGGNLASRHEEDLLKRLRRSIVNGLPEDKELRNLGEILSKASYRDIVTLNFDRTIDRALHAATRERVTTKYAPKYEKATAREHLRFEIGKTRIWHPHGVASDKIPPQVMQLGIVSYAKSVRIVQDAVKSFRERQRLWREDRHKTKSPPAWTAQEADDWNEEIRGPSCNSWIDIFMTSDVCFVGCGLDRAEGDLWLLLHERQRQLRSVPTTDRPSAFFLHPLSRLPQHLTTQPAGLVPIVTRNHEESWKLALE